jgi:exopolysaccharide biosynthesis protein
MDITHGETKIPPNGFVISANGVAGESIEKRFNKGEGVKWFFMTTPAMEDMLHVVAGGPRLVYNGEVYISSKEEKFKKDVSNSRAARTAVGITKKGDLLFVVVENNDKGKGATLEELSELMIKLGAVDAMNLDGGGSSTMVVNGAALNSGAGRPVSNALVVRPKQNL